MSQFYELGARIRLPNHTWCYLCYNVNAVRRVFLRSKSNKFNLIFLGLPFATGLKLSDLHSRPETRCNRGLHLLLFISPVESKWGHYEKPWYLTFKAYLNSWGLNLVHGILNVYLYPPVPRLMCRNRRWNSSRGDSTQAYSTLVGNSGFWLSLTSISLNFDADLLRVFPLCIIFLLTNQFSTLFINNFSLWKLHTNHFL